MSDPIFEASRKYQVALENRRVAREAVQIAARLVLEADKAVDEAWREVQEVLGDDD